MFALKNRILTKQLFLAATCGSILISFTTISTSWADSTKDAAKDIRGNYITSTNGNCVRTRWQDSSDPCAPAPRPQPVFEQKKEVVVSPAKTLQKEQRTVYFEFNKAALTTQAIAKLDSLVTALKSDTNVKDARIVGFADRFGTDAYNEKLSHKRADAVRDYLVGKGFINTTSGEVRWLGKSSPITNCPTKASKKQQISCLAEDRRVEVEIDFLQ